MGTRADFYIGRGKDAMWLGSIAWDGDPNGIDNNVFSAKDHYEFTENVKAFFDSRDDASLPENGWPWPWEDSNTTDYTYAFDNGKVHASCFGSPWFDPLSEPDDTDDIDGEKPEFPNMEDIQNVSFGKRSGTIIIGL